MRNRMIILFVFTLLISGCRADGIPDSELTVTAVSSADPVPGQIIAEAVIEPLQWSELRFEVAGTVAEILVEPGDLVEFGDVLARLDTTGAELKVNEAEAALASAEAKLALVEAEPQAGKIAEAQAELEHAQAAVALAVAQRDQLTGGATEAAVANAEAVLAEAVVPLLEAQRNHQQVHQDSEDQDELEAADYRLFAAEEAMGAAQTELDALRSTADAMLREAEASVRFASAQQEVAAAQLELVKAGSTSWQIAAAEADVQRAQVALASAKAMMPRMVLQAPFAGTVARISIELGQIVTQDQGIVVLATLDQLQARTKDLSELDVIRLSEDQHATVRIDAQPEVVLAGIVRQIALRPGVHRGDVVYAVDVDLTDGGRVPLRWGMTAVVEIDTD